jgi:molybdopterin synthase catalytic subunit
MEYIAESPIVLETVIRQINSKGSGSLLYHFAIVKSMADDDAVQSTTAIRFEKLGDTEAELSLIAGDIREKWNVDDVLLVRRVGTLNVDDIISLVAVSASRSKDAFEACQYGLQRIKKMSTIKKQEIFAV